jgi:serine/threonine protein kinase
MGTVYLARQTELDRYIALKELGVLQAADPAFAERFLRESRMAGSLNHPNIVAVYDYFEHEGFPYIAMEYIARGSLRQFRTLTLTQIAGVLEGLLAGLQHAASRGIVHRDLKPENVMITDEGSVKIADFGIARALNEAGKTSRFLTATGTAIGTPSYMAPEQAMAKEIGPWTDLYSLGIIAYELILGRVPFHDSDTPMSILVRHVTERIPSPRSVDPRIDVELSDWIGRLLEKDPSARPHDAQEARDALEEIVVRLRGPLWRRDARLLDDRAGAEPAEPLTPAPFSEEWPKVDAEGEAPEDLAAHAPFGEAAEVAKVDEGEEVRTGPTDYTTYRPSALPAEPPPSETDVPAPPSEPVVIPPSAVSEVQKVPEEPPTPEPAESPRPLYVTFQRPVKVQPSGPAEHADAPGDSQASQIESEAAVQKAPPSAPEPGAPDVVLPPPLDVVPSPSPTEAPRRGFADRGEPIPRRRPRDASSFVLTDAVARTRRSGRRGRAVFGFVVLGILGGLGVASALVLGGGRPEMARQTSSAQTLPPEPKPKGRDRAAIVADRRSLYVSSPHGAVLRLSPSTLRTVAAKFNPAHPRGLARDGTNLYLADDQTLTTFRGSSLTPLASRGFSHGVALAGGGDRPLAAIRATRSKHGQVCVVKAGRPKPCAGLRFTPTGLGVAKSGVIFVADRASGVVVPYRSAGGKLHPSAPIHVGAQPAGAMVNFSSSMYVPVRRGITVVDVPTLKRTKTIALPATPVALWIAPSVGRIFAALYSRNQVAVVNARTGVRFALIPAGKRPVAVGGTAAGGRVGALYVVDAGDETVSRLNPVTGKRYRSVNLPALRKRSRAIRVLAPVIAASGRSVVATVPFKAGRLDPSELLVTDRRISDGRASLTLWQGGIDSLARRPNTAEGLTVHTVQRPGRVEVVLTSERDYFESLKVSLGRSGKSAVLTLKKPPPEVPPQGGSESTTTSPPPPPAGTTVTIRTVTV